MPIPQGFRARSPRIQRHHSPSPEKTPCSGSGWKCRCHRDFRAKRDSRRSTIIIMRTTLHDPAPNTYYGQWLGKNAGKHPAKPGAIAHNEVVASARVATFDVAERDFPTNRSLARWKFIGRPKGKIRQPGEGPAARDDHAAHRFYPKQQRFSSALPDRAARLRRGWSARRPSPW